MWFQLDPDKSVEHSRWVEYHGLKVVTRLGYEYAVVPIKCKMLKNNKCMVYENRPKMCKEYFCEGTEWDTKQN